MKEKRLYIHEVGGKKADDNADDDLWLSPDCHLVKIATQSVIGVELDR